MISYNIIVIKTCIYTCIIVCAEKKTTSFRKESGSELERELHWGELTQRYCRVLHM